jgi:hypothetical protein
MLLGEGLDIHLFKSTCHEFVVSPTFNSADFLFTLDPNKIAVKTTKTPQVNANINISSAISRCIYCHFFKGIGTLDHKRMTDTLATWVNIIQESMTRLNLIGTDSIWIDVRAYLYYNSIRNKTANQLNSIKRSVALAIPRQLIEGLMLSINSNEI